MSRSRVLGAALAVLTLCACGNPEREKQEQQSATLEKQLAEAKALREGLERERAQLSTHIGKVRAEADEARRAYHRTLAAAAFLTDLEGSELKPDPRLSASLHATRSGFLLEEASRKKDSEALHTLVSELLDPERPCVETKKEETEQEAQAAAEESPECGPCEATAYEDACDGVPKRLSRWPGWTCDSLQRPVDSLPAAAVCTASFDHSAPSFVSMSPYAVDELPTQLEVVRIAFEHGGRLYVSDFPDPAADLYHPTNATGLAECREQTEQNSCVHTCDVGFGRYEDPCACGEEPEYGDEHSDHHDDSEESDEPAEVREARLAAEAAEAAAAEAQRQAEEAAKELEYQQCVAACAPAEPEPKPKTDEAGNPLPPEPARVVRTAWLEAAPAPGLFVVSVETKQLADDDREVSATVSTYVVEHEAMTALWTGEPLEGADTLAPLVPRFEFDEVLRKGREVSLEPLPGMQGRMLTGLVGSEVTVFRFSTEKGAEPMEALETAEICEALKKEPKRFPASYLEACGAEAPVAGEVTP